MEKEEKILLTLLCKKITNIYIPKCVILLQKSVKAFRELERKMTDKKKKIKEQIKKEAEKIRMEMALITGI